MIFRGLEVGVARDLEQLRRFMRDGAFAMTWTTDPPTQPGTYWFKREPTFRAIMVDVRVTEGELTVWWPNCDQPVAKLNAHLRGPIPPLIGTGKPIKMLCYVGA
jgi:hypothetical protein